jgi:hypothetical protein
MLTVVIFKLSLFRVSKQKNMRLSMYDICYCLWCEVAPFSKEVVDMFRPVGKVDGGMLTSIDIGRMESIEFRGKEGDILVFVHKVSTGNAQELSARTRRWIMREFDLKGVKRVVLNKEPLN